MGKARHVSRRCLAIPDPDRSPLYDVRNPAGVPGRATHAKCCFSRTVIWRSGSARLRPLGFAGHASLYSEHGRATRSRRRSVVGLGRLELPTSRLSSARSNQLSYKPLTRGALVCASHGIERRMLSHSAALRQRVRPRRKRNEDGEIPPMELNNPEIAGP